MAERVSKCREEVSKSREKYQSALAEITGYNPRYIEDMTAVFERCQQMEAQRLTFFKDVLFSFHKCLNISQEPTLPQIYEEFHHTINNADHQKDLKWWANNHGVNMAMAWPQFEEASTESLETRFAFLTAASTALERIAAFRPRLPSLWDAFPLRLCFGGDDSKSRVAPSICSYSLHDGCYANPMFIPEYTEEFRDIAKGKSKESLPTGPITLLNQRPVSEDELPPINSTKTSKNSNHSETMNSTQSVALHNNTASANNTIDKKTISAPIAVTNGTASAPKSGKTSPSKEGVRGGEVTRRGEGRGEGRQENPFEEEEWEEEGGALEDSGEPGVPVRALYDYTGAESDELSLRQGDLFEKLEDEDEQGWCKGRKDGRVGLYPANYVEPVGH
ncbi:Protein kinase C and casein kinase substrate in neurons protein 3 [Papilio xuthus]|uniref:Protein kinase C and casein kinase substrate in neurons protein 3 n=1 Tax=Papilio xuthus TaxID=66420 RepID=A0A194PZT4_PAPXU|nr:Protein kinase C and casein kinase substrate in neurons protein 3 [Papilio xuthus]